MQWAWLRCSVVHFLTSPEKTIEFWPVLFSAVFGWVSAAVWLDRVIEIDFFFFFLSNLRLPFHLLP